MRPAYTALEAAELAGAPASELERLERAYLQTMVAYEAACALRNQKTPSSEAIIR
jgi:hypothetical protein